MSEVKEKEDEFVLIRSRKRKGSHKQFKAPNFDINNSEVIIINPETVYKKILSAKEDISHSAYFIHLLEEQNRLIEYLGNCNIKEILCYGLGKFSSSVCARFQFGLLLALKDHLSVSVFIHDPVFSEAEVKLIKQLQCNVIEENEEGKRKITVPTLVYLPHCPKQLTNNFLWTNWDENLNNCILISNSFTKIIESNSDRFLKQNIKYIFDIYPSVKEVEIKNIFKYSDIFNDLSLHIFPKENLNRITESTWKSKPEPNYQGEDLEFIAQKLQKAVVIRNGTI